MAGVYTNGLTAISTGAPASGTYNSVTGYELVPADTGRLIGANPSSVALSSFDVASLAVAMTGNTQTSTANAATSNTFLGKIITEALTTAAGANYTMTLTNTLVAATSTVQARAYSLSNTTAANLSIFSITPAAGSVVILVRNNHAATALNGTIVICYQVAPD